VTRSLAQVLTAGAPYKRSRLWHLQAATGRRAGGCGGWTRFSPWQIPAAGEEGEILTRGPGVTPGYWQRPEETAAALEDGWLHTGDVGKRDEDGWFYLVDRIKDMINVSGYKVWPREVEDVLFRHPALVEASVVGAPDSYRGEIPVAYVVLREGASASEDEVIAHCREQLAVYKAPRRVVFVDEIPKTLTGKALRRELRERERG
jgi:long-chain acyl-CoA synthetase